MRADCAMSAAFLKIGATTASASSICVMYTHVIDVDRRAFLYLRIIQFLPLNALRLQANRVGIRYESCFGAELGGKA
jgi:hypothetical protein